MLNKLTVIFIFNCLLIAELPRHNVDESILYRANIINVTYVKPAFNEYNTINVQEKSFLSKLQILLAEIERGKHPNWRAEEILVIAESYVEMNKTREQKLNNLRKLIKAYH